MTERLYQMLSENPQPEGLIFTYEGKPVHRIKTAWKAAVRRAKIRTFRFKDLRATFNSRLIEAGVIKDVRKELMGHSRNEDTNDLYSHIELPLLRDAIAKLELWRKQQVQMLGKDADGKTDGTTAHSGAPECDPEKSATVGNSNNGALAANSAEQILTGTHTP